MNRPKRTKSGTFEVYRNEGSPVINLRHVGTGLPAGGFSHLRIRTFKEALEGMEAVEARVGAFYLGCLGKNPDTCPRQEQHDARQAINTLVTELRCEFPGGIWGRT